MPISKTYPLPALTDVDDNLDPASGEVLTWDGDQWRSRPVPLLASPFGTPTDRLRVKQGDPGPSWDTGEWLNVRDFGAVGDGASDDAGAFTALAAAVNAVPNLDGTPVVVFFGRGTYRYSGGLTFTRPVMLQGTAGSVLNYTGTGYAVTFGPDGLDDTSYLLHRRYGAQHLRFTGGATFTHGLYFNTHVTEPRLLQCDFESFGTSTGYAAFFQSDNWDILVADCNWYTPSSDTVGRNWIRVRGMTTLGAADNGNSQLRLRGCHALNLNTGGGAGAGVGVWLNGAASQIANSNINGFEPNVRIGSWGHRSRIVHSYFETIRINGALAAIEYGDPSDGDLPSADLQGVLLDDNYCNIHNTDVVNVDAYFLGQTQDGAGLKDAIVTRNHILAADATRELVRQPTTGSGQTGNYASGNLGVGVIHTSGGLISNWEGDQGDAPTFRNFRDTSLFLRVRPGTAANQNAGVQFEGFDGTGKVQIYYAPGSNRITFNHVAASKIAEFDSNGDWRVPGKLWLNGVALANTVVTKAADYTATDLDRTILGSNSAAPITITLPAAAGRSGKDFFLKRLSTQNVVVDGNASETIDGAATKTLGSQFAFLHIVCDATSWFVVSSGGTIT